MKSIRYRIALILTIMAVCLLCGCGKAASEDISYEETTQIPTGLMICTPNTGCPVLGVHISGGRGVF